MATAAKKSNSLPIVPDWLRTTFALVVGPGRTATLLTLLLMGFAAGGFAAWRYVSRREAQIGVPAANGNSPRYTVRLEQVHITPQPAWIHANVRADVFPALSLDRPLSILDDDLVERVARTFALHPWVAKVTRVTKNASGVEVELVYRQPVCTVEVPGDLVPVDAEGVLLPSGDFSPIEKQSYPCLSGIDTRPLGPVGQRWGDGRVNDGAAIAAAVGPVWQQLKLYRIQPSPRHLPVTEFTYDLFTRAGTRINWGLPPTAQGPGELPPSEKVARLVQYANEHGGLEGRDGPQQIDLRGLAPKR